MGKLAFIEYYKKWRYISEYRRNKKLKEKIKEFENQDVFIKLENAIQYHTTINNAKIIVSDEKLIVSDEQEQDFIIELHYLEELEENENIIYLVMSNDLTITLEY